MFHEEHGAGVPGGNSGVYDQRPERAGRGKEASANLGEARSFRWGGVSGRQRELINERLSQGHLSQ